jgi:hypothetical protein
MQKKGVVLLVTLFFIMSISVLILKNLDDSNKFIKETTQDVSLVQIKITNQNVQDEVMKLVNNYKDNIDELLAIASSGIPFDYGNVKLFISIEEYIAEDCNINNIKTDEDLYKYCSEYTTDNISYPYEFINLLKEYKAQKYIFKNKQQVEYFLNKYKQITNDEKIDDIRGNFEVFNVPQDKDGQSTSRLLKCTYSINTNDANANAQFVFKLGEQKIQDDTFVLDYH